MISKERAKTIRALGPFCVSAAVMLAAVIAGGADKVPFPRPDSHKGNWIRSHGMSASMNINEAGQAGNACLTCHAKSDCISCHSIRMPGDHNNFWRTRGHGLTASVNRERCIVCHRQDHCIRCHNETAPRSHVGSWRARHCTWCHYASGIRPADGCGVCHKIAPHNSRPAAHPPIGPQTGCSACHS